jgi:hypothetical protein
MLADVFFAQLHRVACLAHLTSTFITGENSFFAPMGKYNAKSDIYL